ncbi:hypothetical protein M430DRAFT_37543 [Amorphotheca resinae ATCC 22711]|jgi:nucleolar protein TMA23|uniref:G-patch domain-containing protein n=1 Tax=Amorphotheca resinae ATCC 22711 TaxID=857342 RepID=A0A2T3ARB2_AMORE|nr:hypothetical protein M430DRAFT_37543 [Amorphotheca resinae ATCC 22711]PSS08809.1 hypothetical protein M430DRAFT_37543 [Amorphotheca resinae ATCC 22711]
MNAHALLTSQGWRGTGHSLHPTSDETGLSRPLLVSRKVNNLGVGKKQHKTSDMWWMNAFDKSLKGLDTSEEGKVVQKITNGGLDMVVKGGSKYVGSGGGLYASFVRGEPLNGTITEETSEKPTVADQEPPAKKRRKHGDRAESKEERRARKAAKRALRAKEAAAKEEPQTEEAQDASVKKLETKEQRKERKRREKDSSREAEREAGESSSESKKKKKRRKE